MDRFQVKFFFHQNRASHELRTPLTSAMLMAERIQEGEAPKELDEYWHSLKSERTARRSSFADLY